MVAKGEHVILSTEPCKINGFIVQDLWIVRSIGALVPKDFRLLKGDRVYVKPDSLENFGRYKVGHYSDIVAKETEHLDSGDDEE
tara:strand:- start:2279 stop:2530 length:252 start_codon:yes stop_codon:yes gene_type:complete